MRAPAFLVLLIWTLCTLGGHSMSPEQVSAGSEHDRTDAQRGHRISSRSQAGTVFNIDLFTTTLPVCAFHSRLNTKPASPGHACAA